MTLHSFQKTVYSVLVFVLEQDKESMSVGQFVMLPSADRSGQVLVAQVRNITYKM